MKRLLFWSIVLSLLAYMSISAYSGGLKFGITDALKDSAEKLDQKVDEYNVALQNNNGGNSTIPSSPGNLLATTISSTQINLTWTDNSSNETGFRIERKTGTTGTYSQIVIVKANIKAYNNTGLYTGTKYYYRIRAYNNIGNSAYSAESFTTTSGTPDTTPPTIPTLLSPNNGGTSITATPVFDWSDVSDASGTTYGLQLSNSSGFTNTVIDQTELTSSDYIVTTTLSNGTYYWRVRAKDGVGNYSSWTSAFILIVSVSGSIPGAPSNLQTSVISSSQIDLTWTDNSSNETGFRIERKTDTSGTYSEIATVTANAASYSSTGLSASTQYYYRVRAYNNSGNSSYSAEANATTQSSGGTATEGMVLVPAGSFTMGTGNGTVYLDAYYIDKYEVTNGQFKKFMDAGGYSNSSYWTSEGWVWKTSNTITRPLLWTDSNTGFSASSGTILPVMVTWYEAYAYTKWAGKRLPTEAEWEKAARGTDKRTYPWGNTWHDNYCNWFDQSYYGVGYLDGYDVFHTAPVGNYENGKSPYGCYDMAGNVFEWCNDWYDPKLTVYGKVIRGGSFLFPSTYCMTTTRSPSHLEAVCNGFRCAK